MNFEEFLLKRAAEAGMMLTKEQAAAYQSYFTLLLDWNQRVNLTAITEPQEVAVKHMVDSLTCLAPEVFPPGASVIDVGTGAGFPGLPLKIYRPDLKLTLLDSLQKRLKFLAAVLDELAIKDVALVHYRAEDGGRDKELRERFQVAVSRAVARLPVLAELCLPFVKPGGYFVALKGSQYQEEADEAEYVLSVLGARLEKIQPVRLPGLDDVRAVLYIKKIRTMSPEFPRRAGIPEKKPLIGRQEAK